MLDKLELNLKILAVTNMIIATYSIYLVIRYPFPAFTTTASVPVFYINLVIFLTDYFFTALLIFRIRNLYKELLGKFYQLIIVLYLMASLLTRLLMILTSAYFINPIPGDIISVFFTSLLFALLLFKFRSLPIGVHVRNRLSILATLNLFTVFYLFTPIGLLVSLDDLPLGYIIVFLLGGIFKWISYLFAAFLYMKWSVNMPSILSNIHQIDLYDDDHQTPDPSWPSY